MGFGDRKECIMMSCLFRIDPAHPHQIWPSCLSIHNCTSIRSDTHRLAPSAFEEADTASTTNILKSSSTFAYFQRARIIPRRVRKQCTRNTSSMGVTACNSRPPGSLKHLCHTYTHIVSSTPLMRFVSLRQRAETYLRYRDREWPCMCLDMKIW